MAVAFARVLRGAGLAVPTSTVLAFAEALGAVGVAERDDVYWAARATLVRRPEDIGVFDRAFRVFWEHAEPTGDAGRGAGAGADHARRRQRRRRRRRPGVRRGRTTTRRSSCASASTEVLRHKDFAAYDDAELAEAHRLMRRHAAHRLAAPLAAAGADDAAHRPARPAPHRAGRAAHRGRADAPPLPRAGDAPPPARAAARRQRLDGAVRPGPAALRPGGGRRPPTRRGVRPRHPPDPDHPRARLARPRHRPAPGRRPGRRLVGRHPPRRRAAPVQRRVGRARAWPAAPSS